MSVGRLAFAASLLLVTICWPGSSPHAQFWGTVSPYDGGVRPLNISRFVFGKSRAEACMQRSYPEMILWNTSLPNVQYVGWLDDGTPGVGPGGCCGVQWINAGNLITNCTISANPATCSDILTLAANNPSVAVPVPQECVQTCPSGQQDPNTGVCWLFGGGGGGGGGCPECANPLNPATGNKFEPHVDIPPAFSGGVSFSRYYNTGRSTLLTGAYGGYWQHTYSIKIVPTAPDKVFVYRADGKVNPYTLVGGVWTPRPDVADVLVELKDMSGKRTGWTYTVAATDDVETYDPGGWPQSIKNRAGLTTTFTYADGTNGTVSGNGGFFVDLQGKPTTTPMDKGLLLRVQDAFGRRITFAYGSPSLHILKVTDPAGGALIYGYGSHRNVTSIPSDC